MLIRFETLVGHDVTVLATDIKAITVTPTMGVIFYAPFANGKGVTSHSVSVDTANKVRDAWHELFVP